MSVTHVVQSVPCDYINTEGRKYNTAVFSSASQWVLLSGLLQGTSNAGRVGRQVHWCDIEVNLFHNPAAFQMLRVTLVVDRQPNAATPVITNLFNVDSALSTFQPQSHSRFVVLDDTIISPTTILNTDRVPTQHRIAMKLDPALSTVYNSSAVASVAAITTNAVFLVLTACDGTGVGTPPTGVFGYYGLSYYDH